MKAILISLFYLVISGCSTYMPQRYQVLPSNTVALKAIGTGSVNVGDFKGPASFDSGCRGVGPIVPPVSMSFEGYIQKAIADELRNAGMLDEKAPKTTLTGVVENLRFSSSRGLTGGEWDIRVRIISTNGQSVVVNEHYEFESAFIGETACQKTAEAYLPAVQSFVGKLIKSSEFKALLVSN